MNYKLQKLGGGLNFDKYTMTESPLRTSALVAEHRTRVIHETSMVHQTKNTSFIIINTFSIN